MTGLQRCTVCDFYYPAGTRYSEHVLCKQHSFKHTSQMASIC